MASHSTKTNTVMATVWSVLVLLGMALVIAHLIDATRNQSGAESGLIEKTFTTQPKTPSDL